MIEFPAEGQAATSLFLEPLLDPLRMDLESALAIVRGLMKEEPLLDVLLVHKMFDGCQGDIRRLQPDAALRVLALVEVISDGVRVSSSLTPLLRHSSHQVRSKLALVLGRHNTNLSRVKSFLACEDGRIRANAVESLWGRHDPEARALLWQSTEDPNGRVVVNALLGLYRAGEKEAAARLIELAASGEPNRRAGAAWAMGQTRDLAFADALATLCADPAVEVRRMALKSRERLPRSEF